MTQASGRVSEGTQRASTATRAATVRQWPLLHPVLAILLIALALRVGLAVLLAVGFQGHLFHDDATYVVMAAEKASGHTQLWDAFTRGLYDKTSAYLIPLTWLFRLFGPHAVIAQALAAAFGAVTAACVTRLALIRLPVLYALFAGFAVAVLPSQVLFSSLAFKDAEAWAAVAASALLAALAFEARGLKLVGYGIALGLLLMTLGHLRLHTMVVAALALVFAAAVVRGPLYWVRLTAALLMALLLPAVAGAGLGGSALVTANAGSLAEIRAGNAAGAQTAFVQPPSAPPRPTESAPLATQPSGIRGDLRGLPLGLRAVLLDPLPWEAAGDKNTRIARWELIAWWPLLALAGVGMCAVWRNRRVLAFPVFAAGGGILVDALAEGNFGTAFRHRGSVVWVVAVLAAFGLQLLVSARAKRQPSTTESYRQPDAARVAADRVT